MSLVLQIRFGIIILLLPSMSTQPKKHDRLSNFTFIQSRNKSNLNKSQRLKVVEKFGLYCRFGGQFITKQQLIKVLESLGKPFTPQQLRSMVGDDGLVDQLGFQQIINDYKNYIQGTDDIPLQNVFDELSDSSTKKVPIAHLVQRMRNDFDIDITHILDENKYSMTYQEFKSMFM